MHRRFRRRPAASWCCAAAILVVCVARLTYERYATPSSRLNEQPLEDGPCELVQVLDTCTLVVRQPGKEKSDRPLRTATVGLLGVALPPAASSRETAQLGERFTRRFLADGDIRLQLDKRQLDQQERFLAYVFVEDRLLNEELVRAGLARVASQPGDSASIRRRLQLAEEEARRLGRGLWPISQLGTSFSSPARLDEEED